jgi:integrase
MYAVCLLAYYGGLRRGEIAGLRYRNINFEDNTISIDTAIGIKDDGSYTKPPKTPSSVRRFPMPAQLAEGLRQRYELLQPDPNEFVASSKGQQHLHPFTIGVNFKKFVDRNNLKDVYGKPLILHGLRHNLGTIGVSSGMDIASLSHLMGHSSKAITLDTYAEADSDAMILASKKLEEAFRKTDLDT